MMKKMGEDFLILQIFPSPEIMPVFTVLQVLSSTIMNNPYSCQLNGLGSSSTFTFKTMINMFNTSPSPIFSSLAQNVLIVLAILMPTTILVSLFVLLKHS